MLLRMMCMVNARNMYSSWNKSQDTVASRWICLYMLNRYFVYVIVVSDWMRLNTISLNIAFCFKFLRNTSRKLDLLPSSHIGENVLCNVLTFSSFHLITIHSVSKTLCFKPFGAERPIYGLYRTVDLQMLYFKYLFNKYLYWIFQTCCISSVLFSSKCRLFHNSTSFGSCIIHILNTVCARI
jgi:hypothetical protein